MSTGLRDIKVTVTLIYVERLDWVLDHVPFALGALEICGILCVYVSWILFLFSLNGWGALQAFSEQNTGCFYLATTEYSCTGTRVLY